jgi:hypothetical protein
MAERFDRSHVPDEIDKAVNSMMWDVVRSVSAWGA